MKKLPKSRIEFEVSIAWDKWKKYLEQAAAEISEEIKIDGFRPGKAPRNLVEQKVGQGVVYNNAAEKAVQKSYAEFVSELASKEKIEVIGTPEVEIEKIEENKDLKYKATVAIMPEVEIAPKYKEAIKKINQNHAGKKIEVNEKEVEMEMGK